VGVWGPFHIYNQVKHIDMRFQDPGRSFKVALSLEFIVEES